jgi:hypothetical protein
MTDNGEQQYHTIYDDKGSMYVTPTQAPSSH